MDYMDLKWTTLIYWLYNNDIAIILYLWILETMFKIVVIV